MAGGNEPGFVWPPRPVEAEPVPVDAAEVDGPPSIDAAPVPPILSGASLLRRLETDLLGAPPESAALQEYLTAPPEAGCPRCGGVVGPGETDGGGCGSCRGRKLAWERAIRLGGYDAALRDAILACKYRGNRRIGELLGERLGRMLRTDLVREGLDPAGLLLVPVPTTTRRRLANGGLDHTLVLARGVGRVLGLRPTRLLERRHRAQQAGLSAAARARNVSGTIRARSARRLGGVPVVVLVDDVRTTGATATACFRAIRGALAGDAGGRKAGAVLCRFWLATAAVSSRRGPGGVSASGSGSA